MSHEANSSRRFRTTLLTATLGLGIGCAEGEPTAHQTLQLVTAPVSGAIFTTLVDGTMVNANIYEAKEDVYLDGGPGPQAPAFAAGLPEGDYFFQVTDPSGKDLLSNDHITCRRVHVDASGVISTVYGGTNYERNRGSWEAVACRHQTGMDVDHDALTVQLMPYDDTPNAGGVYKVWMTPVDAYLGNADFVPEKGGDSVAGESWQPGNAHGFAPRMSKTDNYKVKRKGRDREPSHVVVKKFHDANLNTMMDEGESWIEGWEVTVVDPLGSNNIVHTTADVMVSAGDWIFSESTPSGTMQTVSKLDDATMSAYPNAMPALLLSIDSDVEEVHEVVFGNVALGQVKACKIFDRDADGHAEWAEPHVAGWPMTLTGTDVLGNGVGPITMTTGASGCITFDHLLPGNYSVTEGSGGDHWMAIGETSRTVTIASHLYGSTLTGSYHCLVYTNVCTMQADFGTKGYWHNKNGLAEITDSDITYVNSLSPYMSESSYFAAGDEPFDGEFSDGTPVEAARNAAGDTMATEGTPWAEISHFLVDSNATGDAREQLAQQLLAFLFNTRHRLDGPDAMLQYGDDFVSAASLIDQAIWAWESGSDQERNEIKTILDEFNNSDAVSYVPEEPCAITP